MKKIVTCFLGVLFIAACATAFAGKGSGKAVGNAGNPGVAPPQSSAHGLSYSEWSARWWQWTFSLPVAEHPLFMDGNVDLSLHQPDGPVWFLGGMFVATAGPDGGYIGKAVRTGTVPAGKALFFPVLNDEFDNATFVPPATMTVPELYGFASDILNGNETMTCEIDGVSVRNLWDNATKSSPYRVATPVFYYWLPPTDNIQQYWGVPVSGSIGPAVGHGVFLMLAPLSVGTHTIHIGGGDPGFFVLDITYNITVK